MHTNNDVKIIVRSCRICGKAKNSNEFYKRKGNKYGIRTECKQCHTNNGKTWYSINKEYRDKKSSAHNLKTNYGMSIEAWQEMFIAQNGNCAICKQPETAFSKKSKQIQKLSVDHDHKTGKIRGLLCRNCNTVLGRVRDNTDILLNMVSYLQIDGD